MDNLSLILQRLRPRSHYVIRGEEYAGIEWYDEVQVKPTLAEVEAAAPAVAALMAIAAIEAAHPVTQRALRDLIYAIGQVYPAGQNTLFYQRVIEVEALLDPLRAQL